MPDAEVEGVVVNPFVVVGSTRLEQVQDLVHIISGDIVVVLGWWWGG